MNQKIEDILDVCLNAIEEGDSLKTCLSRYPEHAADLEPLIKMAQEIQSLPEPEPNQQHLHELLVQVGSSKKGNTGKRTGIFEYWFPPVQPTLIRVAMIFLAFVVIGATTVAFSANSLPGTPLYPVKLLTEKVQFLFTRNSEGKAELRITFSEKRIEELVAINNMDKSLDRELLNATLNEAKIALDGISELPDKRSSILLTKLDHLNAYQQDVLEQIEVAGPGDDDVIQEAIDLCRQRGQWMRQYRMRPSPEIKQRLQKDQNSPWRGRCRWQR